MSPSPQNPQHLRLGDLLVRAGYVTEEQVQVALHAAAEQGCRLGTALVRLGYLDSATLARALGKLRRVPWVEPEAFAHLDLELARRLPAQVAHKRRAVPMKWLKPEGPGGEVLVAFESPPDLDGLDELSFILGARIVPGIAPQELVDDALDRMFPVPRPKAYRVVDLDPHAPLGGVEDNQEQVLRECRAELETHPEGCVLLVDGEHWRALTARRPVLDYVVEYVRRRHDASGQVTVRERRSRHLLAHFTGRGRPVAGKEPPGVNQGVLDELFSQRIHGARGGKSAPGAVASPGVMVPPPPSSGGWGAPMPSFGPPTPSVPTLLGTVPPPTVDMALHELPVRARDVPREGSTVWVGPAPVPGNGHPAPAAWTTPPVPPAALPKTLPPPPPPRSVADVPAPPEDGDSEAWFAEPGSDLDAQGGALGPDDLMLDADAGAGAPAPGFAGSESALAQAAVEQETVPAASDEGARGAARSEVQVPEAGRSDAAPWAPAPEARFIVASDPETRQGTAPELPPLAGPEAASVVTPAPVRAAEPEVASAVAPAPVRAAEPEVASVVTSVQAVAPAAEAASVVAPALVREVAPASEARVAPMRSASLAPAAFPTRPPPIRPPPAMAGAGEPLPSFPPPAHSILEEGPVEAAAEAFELAPVLAAVASAGSSAEVADALAEGLSTHLAAILILVVKHDSAMGWRGHADEADAETIESLIVPLSEPSILARAREAGQPVVAAPEPPEEAIHRRLWRLLRLEPASEVAAAPVLLKGRAVNLIYLHPHPGEALPPDLTAQLGTICEAVAQVFLRLLTERK